jgi:DNA (cytosine-5)-methyltransferase 1
MQSYQPTVNSYFSGAGLMDLGLLQAGLDVQESFELDRDACRTYQYNLGSSVKQRDIAELLVKEQSDSDVMVFTYPCTKYSTIADINGARTGDDLFLHALRHLAVAKPEVYLVENVPGMRAFPVVMEAMTKLPDYWVQVFCPVDSSNWLPQKRKRLFIIGSRRRFAFRPPEDSRTVSLAEILEENPKVSIPQSVYSRLEGKYRDAPIVSDPDSGDIAPTCVAHYAKDKGTRLVKDPRFRFGVRPYTVREYARLQGVPDDFLFPVSESAAYKQIGNGVSVPAARWFGSEIMRYFN